MTFPACPTLYCTTTHGLIMVPDNTAQQRVLSMHFTHAPHQTFNIA